MATIEFVDQTLRDGHQSLWGMRMRSGHALPVAADIDRVGYRIVDYTGSSAMEVMVRHCQENPWIGLDRVHAAMPHSTLRAGARSNAIVGMGLTPNSMLELWNATLAKHGIGSFWIFDCLFNLGQMKWTTDVARSNGMKVSPQVQFGESPVHTDEFFAGVVREMASWGVDSIILGDEAGVLSPQRAQTWIPAMVEAAGGVPLEAHFHNTVGAGTINYVTAVQHGVTILHTAVGPLANGPSMPSIETSVANARWLGHDVAIDTAGLGAVGDHFAAIARAEGHPIGAPREYNVLHTLHQLPGGMTGTLINQLKTYGMESRYDELLEEITIVREEMGYPVMATPFSQLVGIQALLNVVNGERYTVFPDENLMYLAGHMGPIPGTVAPEVMDRAFGSTRGQEFLSWEQPQPSLKEIRSQLGATISDEELLLRFLMPGPDVDAMLAAGLPPTDLSAGSSPTAEMIRTLMRDDSAPCIRYRDGELDLSLRRAGKDD
ncbi:hypothetical protein [Aeromicrobium wangtongii]|uniref:hypothetical protein n=1 Tax=Aeromicrobium wangtongii TaxID=2969247 RepID=UPI0020173E71|nr:hypothetical protein [Aeromicrobium wangtongii]MCL3818615.1 hypothetical protein [Aeromicrobium wangtongii]